MKGDKQILMEQKLPGGRKFVHEVDESHVKGRIRIGWRKLNKKEIDEYRKKNPVEDPEKE